MGVLTKRQIIQRIKEKSIGFTPNLDTFQLQEHAVDLRLGFTFMIPKVWHLTTRGRESLDITHFNKQNSHYFDVVELEEGQYFDLLPQEYVLVSTFEAIKIPNDLMAILYPRSSTNRKGLSLDLTGIIDSGYEGQLTLPIRNNTRSQVVRLYPGERLCQIVFEELTESVTPRPSKYHKHDIIEGVKMEKQNEVKLLMKGDLKTLKKKYGVK
ncbi:MAG TPA: dCTP deaminase [Candidatus Paceibacterota bacterium]|nr:dCTP deaminase [Candidatus Paceibacterota bacterium]